MNPRVLGAACLAAVLFSACSFQNSYEREAQAVTDAVIANNLGPVQKDIAPGIAITRVQVAEWSDELNAQGKLLSLKQVTQNCPPATYCFDVKFQKREYYEKMKLDDKNQIAAWAFHDASDPTWLQR